MPETNRTYRIRTNTYDKFVNIDFTQNYDTFEILSLKITQSNSYRLMQSDTGIIVGRVLANEGFGIPNAKLSVFVEYDSNDGIDDILMYRYGSVTDSNTDGIAYNILPDSSDDACSQPVGTFPSKRYLLDNDDVIDVFDRYYRYTTRTNSSGDYMIYGVPTGSQILHCDVDLSDIGILSQKPRDFIYKGYNANLFDSPSKFRKSTELSSLPQIISQNNTVYVYPFWGDTTTTSTGAAITRCDINIPYRFEPTCVFIGSIITDSGNNSLSKKCVPSKAGGKMSEMVTGSGMIEMIRKTPYGSVEQFSVKGNEVIDDDGTWCYQIPMNLDYVITDEYGNTVLSDSPSKGIPTRTRVRFRISMHENPADGVARKRARYLVPNNPHLTEDYPNFTDTGNVDYEFGSSTKDEDFRDLMWNNVYTVKNYIPRIQKARLPENLKFTGIKMVNHSGKNNPMPYNKLSIKFNFTYTFLCILIKIMIRVTNLTNRILRGLQWGFIRTAFVFNRIANWPVGDDYAGGINGKTPDNIDDSDITYKNISWKFPNDSTYGGARNAWRTLNAKNMNDKRQDPPETSGRQGKIRAAWCATAYMLYACCKANEQVNNRWNINKIIDIANIGGGAAIMCAIVTAIGKGIELEGLCEDDDGNPINLAPGSNLKTNNFVEFINESGVSLVKGYFISDYGTNVAETYNCIENQLAQDNEVTSFNFFNDWVNGVLYMPLWFRKIKHKKKFLFINLKAKDQWCNSDKRPNVKELKIYSNCTVRRTVSGKETLVPLKDDYTTVDVAKSVADDDTGEEKMVFKNYNNDNCYGYKCHKYGRSETPLYYGLIVEKETMLGEHVYYYKPAEKTIDEKDLVTLFATDIVLLGSLDTCDLHGVPQFFKILESTSYQMPPDLVSEDYTYKKYISDNTDENEANVIDESTRVTEYTGADWGNLGVDQSNYANGKYDANENIYDNGGLFYGITCLDSYTKPKSVINLERLCEIGVSLDESQELPSKKVDKNSGNGVQYVNLTPDGYVSYDDIYNQDYRSMFATMNGNFLKTKVNTDTGLIEYDFNHTYIDGFDGSLYNIMSGGATQGFMKDTQVQANYKNNYKLEVADQNYIRFRFGDYLKSNNKKLYFYMYDKEMTTVKNTSVTSANRIPRYENSFYFYFGLTEGKTSIDKFYSTYYSDCSNDIYLGNDTNITFEANEWCTGNGGYIKFDSNLQIPFTLTMTGIDEPSHSYEIANIQAKKFYIGAVQSDIRDFKHYETNNNYIPNDTYKIKITDSDGESYEETVKFYNTDFIDFDLDKYDFTMSNDNLLDFFGVDRNVRTVRVLNSNTGEYEYGEGYVNIINVGSKYNGVPPYNYNLYGTVDPETHVFTQVLAPEVYTYDYDNKILKDSYGNQIPSVEYPTVSYIKYNSGILFAIQYQIPENSSMKMKIVTEYEEGYGSIEQTDMYPISVYNKIADYVDKGFNSRSIKGYIKISNVSCENYKVTVKPLNPELLSGFEGCTFRVVNNTVIPPLHSLLWVDNDIDGSISGINIGVPLGNLTYEVTVEMLCRENNAWNTVGNARTLYVVVYEGFAKLYINGADYDIIKKFNTGWSTYYEISGPQATWRTPINIWNLDKSVFNRSDFYGWDDIFNIGIDMGRLEELGQYPVKVYESFDRITGNPIPNTVLINTLGRYLQKDSEYTINRNPFNATLGNDEIIDVVEYALSNSGIPDYILNGGSVDNGQSNFTENNGVSGGSTRFSSSRNRKTPYNWIDEYVIEKAYWDGFDDSFSYEKDDDGNFIYSGGLVDKCNIVNAILEKRLAFTKMMAGSFRLNQDGKVNIVVECRTKNNPVKYLILEGLDNRPIVNN